MKLILTTLALALVGVCDFAVDSAAAGDQENIQGTWTVETASVDGTAMPGVKAVYVFAGETLTVRPGVGKEQKVTFKLDTASKPKMLIVQHDHHLPGAKPDRTPYDLNGDTLKIAFPTADEHPAEVADKGHVLFTLKRKKP